jgi:hypothetical protein
LIASRSPPENGGFVGLEVCVERIGRGDRALNQVAMAGDVEVVAATSKPPLSASRRLRGRSNLRVHDRLKRSIGMRLQRHDRGFQDVAAELALTVDELVDFKRNRDRRVQVHLRLPRTRPSAERLKKRSGWIGLVAAGAGTAPGRSAWMPGRCACSRDAPSGRENAAAAAADEVFRNSRRSIAMAGVSYHD